MYKAAGSIFCRNKADRRHQASAKILVRILLFICCFSCGIVAHAGHYALTYSGGQVINTYWNGTQNVTETVADFAQEGGLAWGIDISGAVAANAGGTITATFTWTPDYAGDTQLPPQAAIVKKFSDALWGGGPGSCDDGLSDVAVPVTGGGGAESSGTHYIAVANPGLEFTVSCTPTATCSAIPGAANKNSGNLFVAFTATETDVRLSFTGVVDPSANKSLLIGESFGASISTSSNFWLPPDAKYTWSVSITGLPFSNYVASNTAGTLTSFYPPTNNATNMSCYFAIPGLLANGGVPVSCTLSIPSLNLTCVATDNVNVVAPTFKTISILIGQFYLATKNSSGVLTTDPSLPLVPTEFDMKNFNSSGYAGVSMNGNVTDPGPPYTNGTTLVGQWNFTQLFNPTNVYGVNTAGTTLPSAYPGVWSLDHSFPYANLGAPFPTDAPGQVYQFRDSPSFPSLAGLVKVNYTATAMTHLMFLPPYSTSCWVPVQETTWNCSAQASLVNGTWVYTGGAQQNTAGTPSNYPVEPQWTSVLN